MRKTAIEKKANRLGFEFDKNRAEASAYLTIDDSVVINFSDLPATKIFWSSGYRSRFMAASAVKLYGRAVELAAFAERLAS